MEGYWNANERYSERAKLTEADYNRRGQAARAVDKYKSGGIQVNWENPWLAWEDEKGDLIPLDKIPAGKDVTDNDLKLCVPAQIERSIFEYCLFCQIIAWECPGVKLIDDVGPPGSLREKDPGAKIIVLTRPPEHYDELYRRVDLVSKGLFWMTALMYLWAGMVTMSFLLSKVF